MKNTHTQIKTLMGAEMAETDLYRSSELAKVRSAAVTASGPGRFTYWKDGHTHTFRQAAMD